MSEQDVSIGGRFLNQLILKIIGIGAVFTLMSTTVKAQWDLVFDHSEHIQDFFFTDENTGYVISK